MEKQDIQRVVTDRIIHAIEKGGLAAWIKPWADIAAMDRGIPYNFLTGNEYRGINVLILALGACENGFRHNAWLTYKQAQQLGGQVKKGSRSQMCVFFKVEEKRQLNESTGEEDVKVFCPRIPFYLFNVDQVDGLDLSVMAKPAVTTADVRSNAVTALVNRQCEQTQLTFRHSGNSACYSPGLDLIRMPEGNFSTGDNYAATLAHELIHATGHARRLDRHRKIDSMFPQDSRASYAFEELVAELGSAFLCAEHGIIGEHLQHEAYIDSWLKALKRDKTLIFKAAKLASDAHHFVARNPETVVVRDSLAVAA